jgi:hypothetical protein
VSRNVEEALEFQAAGRSGELTAAAWPARRWAAARPRGGPGRRENGPRRLYGGSRVPRAGSVARAGTRHGGTAAGRREAPVLRRRDILGRGQGCLLGVRASRERAAASGRRGAAHGPRHGGGRADAGRGLALWRLKYSDWPCSNGVFSKNLNKSAQVNE